MKNQRRSRKTLVAIAILSLVGIQAAPALAVNLRLIDRRITSGNRLIRDTDNIIGLADIDFGANETSVPLAVNFNDGPLTEGRFRLDVVPPERVDGKNEILFDVSSIRVRQGALLARATPETIIIRVPDSGTSSNTQGQILSFDLLADTELGQKPDNDSGDLRFQVRAGDYQIRNPIPGPTYVSSTTYDAQKVPEPLTVLGAITALSFGMYCKRNFLGANADEQDT